MAGSVAAVDSALERFGILPVFGQISVPSVADLLAGVPVRPKGYSRIMRPAWDYVDARVERGDVLYSKLLSGRRCLVHQDLWRAVDSIGVRSINKLGEEGSRTARGLIVGVIASNPGIAGEELKSLCTTALEISLTAYRNARLMLETYSAIFGLDRTDVDYHTHDQSWHLWGDHWVHKKFANMPTLSCDEIRGSFALKLQLGDTELERLIPAFGYVCSSEP